MYIKISRFVILGSTTFLTLLSCVWGGHSALATFSDTAVLAPESQQAITQLESANVIRGYPDHTFQPSKTLNRAEFLALIARMHTQATTPTSTQGYADVAVGSWFESYVQSAAARGLIDTPRTEKQNRFFPETTIVRAELWKIVALHFSEGDADRLSRIQQSTTMMWYSPYRQLLLESGILDQSTMNEPGKLVSREEVALVLSRMSNYKEYAFKYTFSHDAGVYQVEEQGGTYLIPLFLYGSGDTSSQAVAKDMSIRVYDVSGDQILSLLTGIGTEYSYMTSGRDIILNTKNKSLLKESRLRSDQRVNFVSSSYNLWSGTISLTTAEFGQCPSRALVTVEEQGVEHGVIVNCTNLTSFIRTSQKDALIVGYQTKTQEVAGGALIMSGSYRGTLGSDGVSRAPITSLSDHVLVADPVRGLSITGVPGYVLPQKTEGESDLRAYMSSDRPIYKGGDTVEVFGVIRSGIDAHTYGVPSDISSITFDMKTYDNGVWRTIRSNIPASKTSALGGFSVSVALPIEAKVGSYTVYLKKGSSSIATYDFQVEAYKKDTLDLSLELPTSLVYQGDIVQIPVLLSTFYGTPVAAKSVTYTVSVESQYYPCRFICPMYSSKSFYPQPYPQEIDSGTLTTDASGRASISIDTNKALSLMNGTNSMSYSLRIKASSKDDQLLPIVEQGSLQVFPSAVKISTTQKSYVLSKGGEQHVVTTVSSQSEDRPLGQQAVSYSLEYLSPQFYTSNDYTPKQIATISGVTNASGRHEWRYVSTEEGSYTLTISSQDSQGRIAESTVSWYVYAPQSNYYLPSTSETFSVISPKDSYLVGETVPFYLNQPTTKKILRSVVQDGILSYTWLHPTSYDLPGLSLNSTHVPSVNVTFDQLGAELASSEVQLAVHDPNKKITISAQGLAQEVTPHSSVKLDLSLKSPTNSAGEAHVIVVDDAIYELLTDAQKQDIYETFWQQQYFSSYLLRYVNQQGMYPTPYPAVGLGGAVTREEDGVTTAAKDEASSPSSNTAQAAEQVRSDFRDTAYFLGAHAWGSDGMIHTSFTLPDSLTRWRVIVIAYDAKTNVGSYETTFVAKKPVAIEPRLPRFLVQGDTMTLPVSIVNTTNEDDRGVLTMTDTNTKKQLSSLEVVLKRNQSTLMSLPLKDIPKLASWDLTFSYTSSTSQARDIMLAVISINDNGSHKKIGHFYDALFALPLTTHTSDTVKSGVTVVVSSLLYDQLLESLKELVGYPYGCVEQTMSKFLPTLAMAAYEQKRGASAGAMLYGDEINAALDRLTVFQHSDGGWGWWETDSSNIWMTSYVLEGLAYAKQYGYAEVGEMQSRAVAYLEKNLESMTDQDVKEYALYVLALHGSNHEEVARVTSPTTDIGIVFSAMRFATLKNLELAQTLLKRSLSHLKVTDRYRYLEISDAKDGRIASQDLLNARLLQALARIIPNSTDTPKLISYINSQRRGGMYHDTQATSQSVIGLTQYLDTHAEALSGKTYELYLDDQRISSGSLSQKTEVFIPSKDLHSVKTLSLKTDAPYAYTSVLEQVFYTDSLPSTTSPVTVSRRFLDPVSQKEKMAFQVGDMVIAELKLDTTQELSYVMIKDPLVAGFEAVNTRLKRDQGSEEPSLPWWERGWYASFADIYNDHVAFFETALPKGTRTYTYKVYVTSEGAFTALPPEVGLMYDPDLAQLGKKQLIKITK